MPRVDGLRRCGECATCLNPAAKQACLRNKELREEKQRAEAEEQARQELERRARAAAEDAQRAAQEAAPGPQQQQQRPEPPGAGLVAAGSSAQPKYTHERRLLLFTARYEFVSPPAAGCALPAAGGCLLPPASCFFRRVCVLSPYVLPPADQPRALCLPPPLSPAGAAPAREQRGPAAAPGGGAPRLVARGGAGGHAPGL